MWKTKDNLNQEFLFEENIINLISKNIVEGSYAKGYCLPKSINNKSSRKGNINTISKKESSRICKIKKFRNSKNIHR
ncbi:MAG: hypothetical protein GXO21_07960 [Aquificae bacterium]|nr:hypothetical protein [Aquificota bacterium]